MRGKAPINRHQAEEHGITLAYAGKSCPPQAPTFTRQDHPRVCGEKISQTRRNLPLGGSPPRVRGKVRLCYICPACPGITPACAGKSCSSRRCCGCRWDHPRACGEKSPMYRFFSSGQGSPPRMRGKVLGAGEGRDGVGITPAYAGKRKMREWIPSACRDHPRVCGEKFHPASDRKLGRVRGTKRSSGPAPAAAPAGLAGSCPASPPWSYPPRITVISPRP